MFIMKINNLRKKCIQQQNFNYYVNNERKRREKCLKVLLLHHLKDIKEREMN